MVGLTRILTDVGGSVVKYNMVVGGGVEYYNYVVGGYVVVVQFSRRWQCGSSTIWSSVGLW